MLTQGEAAEFIHFLRSPKWSLLTFEVCNLNSLVKANKADRDSKDSTSHAILPEDEKNPKSAAVWTLFVVFLYKEISAPETFHHWRALLKFPSTYLRRSVNIIAEIKIILESGNPLTC